MLLVRAFQESAGQGLLCLFVPVYIFFWAFSRMSQGNQQLVTTWLISAGIGWVSLFLMGALA